MTIRELIEKLSEYPQDAEVHRHDCGDWGDTHEIAEVIALRIAPTPSYAIPGNDHYQEWFDVTERWRSGIIGQVERDKEKEVIVID